MRQDECTSFDLCLPPRERLRLEAPWRLQPEKPERAPETARLAGPEAFIRCSSAIRKSRSPRSVQRGSSAAPEVLVIVSLSRR